MSVEDIVASLGQLDLKSLPDFDGTIQKLGHLAVKLRDSEIRSNPNVTRNIGNLITSLDWWATASEPSINMEILRVMVNLIAYNDSNRLKVSENSLFSTALRKLLLENAFETSQEYSERIVILLQNLTIGNGPADTEEEEELASAKITQIFNNLHSYGVLDVLTSFFLRFIRHAGADVETFELFGDFLEFLLQFYTTVSASFVEPVTVDDLRKLITAITKICKSIDPGDLDEAIQLIGNLSHLMFLASEQQQLEAPNPPQLELFNLLRSVDQFESSLSQKLHGEQLLLLQDSIKQVNRRIFAVIGNLSSNLHNRNTQDIDLALQQLDKANTNNYILSSAFLILANSIGNTNDRDALFNKEPHLIQKALRSIVPDTENIPFGEYYLLIQNRKTQELASEKQKIVKHFKNQITFFTEPLLDQSLFHLVKLVVTAGSRGTLPDCFISEFIQWFPLLENLILVNFNSMFFLRVNLPLILKFLNSFIKNFLNYSEPPLHEWFFTNKKLILSLCVSVRTFLVVDEGVFKIIELNVAQKLDVMEIIQSLLNCIVTKKITLEPYLQTILLDSVFADIENTTITPEVSFGSSGGSSTPDSNVSEISHLSSKFITLTLLSSSDNLLILEYLIADEHIDRIVQTIESAIIVTEKEITSNTPNSSETFLLKGLKNNLKVFIFRFNLLLNQTPKVRDDVKNSFDNFILTVKNY